MTQKRSLFATLVAGVALSGVVGAAILPTRAQPPVQEPTPGQNPTQEKPKNAYETARMNPRLKNFIAAVDAAGLADTLSGPGPYTILAPTNKAFDKLPAGTLADLRKPENKQKLADILKYHIIIGRYTYGDLKNQEDKALLRTVNGSPVKLNKTAGGRFNDNVKVVTSDIPVENGVIHIVDTVLLPPSATDTTTTNPTPSANPSQPDPNKPNPANPNPADPANPNKPNP